MRKLFAFGVIAAASLTVGACGGDDENSDSNDDIAIDAPKADAAIDSPTIDAPPDSPPADADNYDFSCMTNPVPTTAPAEISLSGITQELSTSISPLPGVTLSVHNNADTSIATTTSGTDGTYTTSFATGGVPFEGSLFATKQGGTAMYRRSVIVPPYKLAGNTVGLPTLLIQTNIFNFLATSQGIEQDDTANGVIFVITTDCAGTRIPGAVLHAKQGGVEVGEKIDLAQIDMTNGQGVTGFTNVPPGVTEISGSYNGHNFITHNARSYKAAQDGMGGGNGTLTQTLLVPGYPDAP